MFNILLSDISLWNFENSFWFISRYWLMDKEFSFIQFDSCGSVLHDDTSADKIINWIRNLVLTIFEIPNSWLTRHLILKNLCMFCLLFILSFCIADVPKLHSFVISNKILVLKSEDIHRIRKRESGLDQVRKWKT